MARDTVSWNLKRTVLVAFATLATCVVGTDILKTTGFTDCGSDASIKVDRINISYDKDNRTVIFDVAGTSTKQQNVTAVLDVTAYGNSIYSKSFNPCDAVTFIQQLCPLPVGTFAARGTQEIPAQFANMVPGIAFQVPDISAQATLELKSAENNQKVACIKSAVSNGKTASVPAVSYVAAGIAGIALVATGISAAGAALSGGSAAAAGSGAGGAGTVSPSFTEVVGWFQGMAMNGMLSVSYPPVYRSFTKNFGFAAGLIPWVGMQSAIDTFREKTGGNLTRDNVQYVRNATMIYSDGSASTPDPGLLHFKRHISDLLARAIETSVNGTAGSAGGNSQDQSKFQETVTGIQAYAQRLAVPKSDIFMNALLILAILIAGIVLIILLVKVILEVWAIWGNFPKALAGFRKHYWGSIGRTITSLILLLYGIWVLYCVFQFTRGDSWAAKTLAGVTLALFTAILAFFSWKIWSTVRKLKATEGNADGLYDKKEVWIKYSIFYDSYRKGYWWLFVPFIVYMFAKGFAIAIGDGRGMQQTIAQLIIEALMLGLLVWARPFERRSGNVINITIQVVRVLSIGCILIFVEEFAVQQTTKTAAGVALIVVQSILTGVLAILIVWNAINVCCKANPHRQRRKELEKLRDTDNLTPLDPRNSLLIPRPPTSGEKSMYSVSTMDLKEKHYAPDGGYQDRYYPSLPAQDAMLATGGATGLPTRSLTGPDNDYQHVRTGSRPDNNYQHVRNGSGPDNNYQQHVRNGSGPENRQPTLPNLENGYGGGQNYRTPNGNHAW